MELTLTLHNPDQRVQLFGPADAHLRLIRQSCNVHLTARDGRVHLAGTKEALDHAAQVLDLMQQQVRRLGHLSPQDVQRFLADTNRPGFDQAAQAMEVYVHGRRIVPRSTGQAAYIDAMHQHDLVFCTGPAGTGKTYLAVAVAVSLLKQSAIRRIVLARPAVEAGEKLGFLPGDLEAKVNPYLRPLFDALGDMMDYNQIKRFMLNDIIEVVPLAFMRGRTLNDALIILDEAQNATVSQMLMFLTRMGHDSKMIVTGDDSQVDLEPCETSGLIDALARLKSVPGIAFSRLNKSDIVRHKLVQNIVKAYENRGPKESHEQEET